MGFIKKIRVGEILLMTGFVLIAIPFAREPLGLAGLGRTAALLFVANFLLLVAVYSANGFFGFHADRLNPRFENGQFSSRRSYQVITVASLAASLLLLALIRPLLPLLGSASFALWVFYSAPGGGKGRPIVGTLVHLFGQVLQFHLGILAFTNASPLTFAISLYLGLLFASGHLMHEVMDHESDAKAGIRTNSVVFGKENVIRFYRRAVIVIPIYWGLLGTFFIAGAEFWPFFVASVVHVALAFTEPFAPGTERFRSAYRVIYFVAGLATFVAYLLGVAVTTAFR